MLAPLKQDHIRQVDHTNLDGEPPTLGLTMKKQYQNPTDKPVRDYAARLNKGGWQFWNAEKTSSGRLRIEYRPETF